MPTGYDNRGYPLSNTSPAQALVAITKSDATDLTALGIRALWVGTGGDVAIQALNDDDAVTLVNVPDGTLLPVYCKKVMSTNTTASDIVGLS
jgi:hypothetical protein